MRRVSTRVSARVCDRPAVGRDRWLELKGAGLRQLNRLRAVDRQRVQIALALEDDRLRSSGLSTASGGPLNHDERDDDEQTGGDALVHRGTNYLPCLRRDNPD